MHSDAIDLLRAEQSIVELLTAIGAEMMAEAMKAADTEASEVIIDGDRCGSRRTSRDPVRSGGTWRETLKEHDDGADNQGAAIDVRSLVDGADGSRGAALGVVHAPCVVLVGDVVDRRRELAVTELSLGTGIVEAAAKTIVMKRAGSRFSQHAVKPS
jgi:hypothetical protein